MENSVIISAPSEPQHIKARFLFAHGAGADMSSDFMQEVAEGLSAYGIEVIRFNFPYMQQRQLDGKKRPPDRMPKLTECFRHHIEKYQQKGIPLYIGGKSMGGRVASLVLEDSVAKAAVVFGFPFHAPGKDVKGRIDHLSDLQKGMMILQGSRDTMGTYEEVNIYKLSDKIEFFWLADGDHSLKPRKKSGFFYRDHMQKAIASAAYFMLK